MFLNKFRLVTAMHRNGPLPQVNMLSRYVITVRIQDLAKLDKLFTKVRVNLHFVVNLNSRGRICMSYSIIRKIQDGSLLEVMIVVTPAAVAISAAMSFVSIPPVPRLDHRLFLFLSHSSGQFRLRLFTQFFIVYLRTSFITCGSGPLRCMAVTSLNLFRNIFTVFSFCI